MKTKHLLYTLALAGTFAACTNEEFLTDAPLDNLKADRPTVSNVTLNVTKGDGADTRLAFNGSYAWEDGDKIAALLMDENNTGIRYGSATGTDEWNALAWLEKYHLVDYVHTNFAFAYNGSTKEWNSTGNCNMLEGNYFLTYPYITFDGKRQAYYDISKQKQVGNTQEARLDAYAKNQVFAGYAQLEAKEGASVLNAKMSEVLAPVRINIQSNCTEVQTEPLTVNKIVLMQKTFSSHYTIDPTSAEYGAWNLKDTYDDNDAIGDKKNFNYANYLDAAGLGSCKGVELYEHLLFGSQAKDDYVYNVEEGKVGNVKDLWSLNPSANERKVDSYYYDDAIRRVVRPLTKGNWTENTTNYVEVYTYDTYADEDNNTPMTLRSGSERKLGIVSMVPAFQTKKDSEALLLYIYTNKGVVGPVDLSEIHTGNTSGSVGTTDAILAANPSMQMQTVTVLVDDDDIIRISPDMVINNTDDLKNFVQWATANQTSSELRVYLTNDVTINDELAAAIKGIKKEKGILYFFGSNGKEANVNIATTAAQADILEFIDVDEDLLVEVVNKATVNLTQAAHNYQHSQANPNDLNILVDKGGILNVVDSNNPGVGGWSTLTNVAKDFVDINIKNNGEVNVVADVEKNSGIKLINKEGQFNVKKDGSIILANESVNEIKGTIVVENGGELTASTEENVTNYGVIKNAGELYNIKNVQAATNPEKIMPGRVYITDLAARTHLATNTGRVIYEVLPTVPVTVEDGNYGQGMFEFTSETSVSTAALTTAHVTDFTITGGTLKLSTVTTTLRHLTVKNAAVVGKENEPGWVNSLVFGAPASGNVATAVWNTNKLNTINLIGNSTVTTASFNLNNAAADADEKDQVVLSNDGAKKDISFFGVVSLGTRAKFFAPVDLQNVTLTAADGANVNVEAFYATTQSRSTIKIQIATVTASNTTTKYDSGYITVSGGTIK